MPSLLSFVVTVQVALSSWARSLTARLAAGRSSPDPRRTALERGQATAEYALVLLGAAAIALLLVAWAAKSGKIGELFDTVVGQLIDRAG